MQSLKILVGLGIFCGLVSCGSSGESKQLQSDKIVEGWDRLDGKWWLLPNLKDARVVLPDRPHSRSEIDSSHQGAAGLKRVREYRLTTSSLRLRGPELGAKKDGVVRIAAIGDSVTHGWGVTRAESYPAQLEQVLTQRGYAVEVINAGAVSYTHLTLPTKA